MRRRIYNRFSNCFSVFFMLFEPEIFSAKKEEKKKEKKNSTSKIEKEITFLNLSFSLFAFTLSRGLKFQVTSSPIWRKKEFRRNDKNCFFRFRWKRTRFFNDVLITLGKREDHVFFIGKADVNEVTSSKWSDWKRESNFKVSYTVPVQKKSNSESRSSLSEIPQTNRNYGSWMRTRILQVSHIYPRARVGWGQPDDLWRRG